MVEEILASNKLSVGGRLAEGFVVAAIAWNWSLILVLRKVTRHEHDQKLAFRRLFMLVCRDRWFGRPS